MRKERNKEREREKKMNKGQKRKRQFTKDLIGGTVWYDYKNSDKVSRIFYRLSVSKCTLSLEHPVYCACCIGFRNLDEPLFFKLKSLKM